MGLTIDTRNQIVQRAKAKPDGVFSVQGVAYRVRNKRVTHIATCGDVVACHGIFDVKVDTYNGSPLSALKNVKESP